MIAWGHDFGFADAGPNFGNMSLIMNYINIHPEYNMHARYRYNLAHSYGYSAQPFQELKKILTSFLVHLRTILITFTR